MLLLSFPHQHSCLSSASPPPPPPPLPPPADTWWVRCATYTRTQTCVCAHTHIHTCPLQACFVQLTVSANMALKFTRIQGRFLVLCTALLIVSGSLSWDNGAVFILFTQVQIAHVMLKEGCVCIESTNLGLLLRCHEFVDPGVYFCLLVI